MAFGEIFSSGTRRVVPSGQDSSILPARVANDSAGFYSFCPVTYVPPSLPLFSLPLPSSPLLSPPLPSPFISYYLHGVHTTIR